MYIISNMFFALLRMELWGKVEDISQLSSKDWQEIFRIAKEQAVVGIVTNGIELWSDE